MTDTTPLKRYVESLVREGASRHAIMEKLTAVGWSDDEASAAYAEALVTLGVPTPGRGGAGKTRAGATETVVSLFSFILLGIISIALGALYFQLINLLFPDAKNVEAYLLSASRDAAHYAMAALIVGFPLYVLVMRFWFRKYKEGEGKSESTITKWLTYLVLLVTAVTLVGDLINVIFTFLRGDLTIRFFLKALVVFGVAGAVFGFYYLERKKVQYGHDVPRKTFQLFGWVVTAVVLVGVAAGFMVAGTPAGERARSFDDQRASNLSQLSNCIIGYANQYRVLPDTLDALARNTQYSYCAELYDPETGEAYGYSVIRAIEASDREGVQEGEFELCAVFTEDTTKTGVTDTSYARPVGADKWYTHSAGRVCDQEVVPITDLPTKVIY